MNAKPSPPRLKQLELHGFKSFADPTTLTFPPGITAIVGPNGSGKSNIADAVRWVLGEQRMLNLRGRSGEDMIFAGSKRRPRAGMARVALLFDNSEHWLPLDFEEVAIERRVYRDGRGEYRLNGRRIRLSELRDLLDRAGLGRDAYFTIGQGVVDRILSLRAGERLAIFEQAAGIAPYRRRREEALRRLDETARNIERVQDILTELEPRLHRLERQVKRMREARAVKAALRERQLLWYGYRWGEALNALESARQKRAYLAEQVRRRASTVEELQQRLTEHRQQLSRLRTALTQLHHESSARHRAAEQAQRELAVARERSRLLRERLEEEQANLIPQETALAEQQRLLNDLEMARQEAAEKLEEDRRQLATLEAEREALETRRRQLMSAQAAAEARALEARHHLADRAERLRQAESALTRLQEEEEELETTAAQRRAEIQSAQAAVEAARHTLASRAAAVEAKLRTLDTLRAEEAESRRQITELQQRLTRLEGEREALATRLTVLERIEQEGEGLYEGVRAVLRAVQRGQLHGLTGTIAALLTVPPHLERAIETALGSQVQSIVAEKWGAAQEAIAYLKAKQAGRATFLPLDTLRPPPPLTLPDNAQGIIGVASDLVHYDPAIEAAVRLLLGRVVVVEDLEAARRLHRRLRGSFRIVTLDGELLRSDGTLTGGHRRRRGNGLIARRRERRQLPRRIAQLEEKITEARQELGEKESALEPFAQRLQSAEIEAERARRAHRAAEAALDEAIRRLERHLDDRRWDERRREQLRTARQREEERLRDLQTAITEAQTALAEAEQAANEATLALQALAEAEVEGEEPLAQARAEVARREREVATLTAQLDARRAERRRLARQIEKAKRRLATLETELKRVDEALVHLRTDYEKARAEAQQYAERLPQLEAEVAQLEAAQVPLETQRRQAQEAAARARARLTDAELEVRRREDRLQALRREIEETLEIVITELPNTLSLQAPLPLAASATPLPTVTELPAGLEQEIRDLRTQMRRLGPINPALEEEHAELHKRATFLREQLNDLQIASSHLRTLIGELDTMMKEAMDETFQAVARAFTRTFKELFNGGTARLSLLHDENGEAVGVEITARPPGKRTTGLGMLSGGERTLTAIALLFALMDVSPTPFCILDEVDAMLDEANVGRFRAHLEALAERTQFIIITHNRGTVEAAETIYGVSMGDDGVSQLLSLRLESLPQH